MAEDAAAICPNWSLQTCSPRSFSSSGWRAKTLGEAGQPEGRTLRDVPRRRVLGSRDGGTAKARSLLRATLDDADKARERVSHVNGQTVERHRPQAMLRHVHAPFSMGRWDTVTSIACSQTAAGHSEDARIDRLAELVGRLKYRGRGAVGRGDHAGAVTDTSVPARLDRWGGCFVGSLRCGSIRLLGRVVAF